MVDANDTAAQQKIIDDVIRDLEVFWMAEDEDGGEAIFNKFAEQHAHKFEGDYASPDQNDNKLEYTAIHKEYQTMFEAKMTAVIEKTGYTVEQFYKALAATQDSEDSMASFYVEMITSLGDYEQFVIMMRDYKSKNSK